MKIMAFTKTKFKTIKLTENDCIFVHYVLRMYASTTEGLEQEDKDEIREIAAKFYRKI